MRGPLKVCIPALALALNACGSDEGSGAGGYLSAQAQRELADLGIEEYRGKARITEQVAQGEVQRVTFDPASGPICLYGTEYRAFYLDRGSDKTMILLDGGGACWTGLCAASKEADEAMAPIGPADPDPSNYFSDWNVVFAPYCDGSVFVGDNQVDEGGGRTRYHHGRQNLWAAMDVAAEHFGDSKQVLIGGFSAGGYGTLPGMMVTRLVFPKADLLVMNDSGPGLQNPEQSEAIELRLAEWKFAGVIPATCTECDQGRGQLSQLMGWMLDNDSNVRVSLLSFYGDPVIGTAFNGLDATAYEELLRTESGKIQSAHPDRFKRYMVPGANHVISQAWATITADGVKVSEWMAGMARGDANVWKDLLASGP